MRETAAETSVAGKAVILGGPRFTSLRKVSGPMRQRFANEKNRRSAATRRRSISTQQAAAHRDHRRRICRGCCGEGDAEVQRRHRSRRSKEPSYLSAALVPGGNRSAFPCRGGRADTPDCTTAKKYFCHARRSPQPGSHVQVH